MPMRPTPPPVGYTITSGTRHPSRSARFERPRGEKSFVFDQETGNVHLGAQTRRRIQRCHRLAERNMVLARHRQELAIPPERLRPLAECVLRDGVAQAPQVVAHEERTAVRFADLLDLLERKVFLAPRALEMRRERGHAARSILAPSARSLLSSSS